MKKRRFSTIKIFFPAALETPQKEREETDTYWPTITTTTTTTTTTTEEAVEEVEAVEAVEAVEVAVVVVVAEEAENAATREFTPRRLLPDRRNRNRLKTR